eukprot:scaffold778_cov179-Ochromonas_danica.AAC.1
MTSRKQELTIMKDKRQTAIFSEVIGSGLQSARGILINKLRTALLEYPNIRIKLQGRVQLPTGEVILDPLNTFNLCGMYCILYRESPDPVSVKRLKSLYPPRLALTAYRISVAYSFYQA